MDFKKAFDHFILGNRKRGCGGRQLAALVLVFGLGACSSDDDPKVGTVGFVEGFLGGVAADEPRAAIVGREILSAGGSAADAAAAVYFALAVTLPSSASLGGGGVCLVHDWPSGNTEALEFLARAPAVVPPGTTRPSAVPGNARGFFALHAKYGALRWGQVVGPAESLARFGIQVSRAFARDVRAVEPALLAEAGSRRIFARPGGVGLVGEGDFLTQLDLAGTLARLRGRGPGDFYGGQLARTLVAGVERAGGSLLPEDLRTFAPRWLDTVKVGLGNLTVHFAPAPAAAGIVAAQMFAMSVDGDRYEDAAAEERPHVLAETALRAFADRGRWLGPGGASTVPAAQLTAKARLRALLASYRAGHHVAAAGLDPAPVKRLENPAATSFVTIDRDGSAVACALTANNLFGTGRIAEGTGIVIGAMPGQSGRGPTSLGPMLAVNHNVNEFFFAAAAAGGVTAPTALTQVALASLVDGRRLEDAIAAPRVHHGGVPDVAYVEKGLGAAAVKALRGRGHRVSTVPSLGLVNAANCLRGLPPNPGSCSVRADPRGFGLAASADR